MKTIYIAAPYSLGDIVLNVRAAIYAADEVMTLGWVAFVPHLTAFWHLVSPKPYEEWLRIDLVWLEKCDAVVRLPGASSGADKEVAHAKMLSIPVYFGLENVPRVEDES